VLKNLQGPLREEIRKKLTEFYYKRDQKKSPIQGKADFFTPYRGDARPSFGLLEESLPRGLSLPRLWRGGPDCREQAGNGYTASYLGTPVYTGVDVLSSIF
jgi:hypothetical protein